MDRTLRERDRLLARSARALGLGSTAISAVCASIPGALPAPSLVAALPALAGLAVLQWRAGRSDRLAWHLAVWAVSVVVAGLLIVGETEPPDLAVRSAIAALTGGSAGSTAFMLVRDRPGRIALLPLFVVAAVVALIGSVSSERPAGVTAFTLAGWAFASFIGMAVVRSVPEMMRRVSHIGRAHRTEREASEREAQRRQSARLLHDTVLATLTLLAHAGRGVSSEALRKQAAGDARLLRQLRLGASPKPRASGTYRLDVMTPGHSLDEVKERFSGMGLTVHWHGTGTLPLPDEVRDPFIMALSECLENVRRHAGVDEAHVTITDDPETVRALVVDTGVGFELGAVDTARLGFAESVVARLRDLGGTAKVFSSAGAGTTVVLEVPRR